jgi:Domain of unknown function (DUF1772)
MVTRKLGTLALMVSIILWGTLLGGIIYSHLVFFPKYLSDLPNSAVLVNGVYGMNESTFWWIIHPLLIISLIVTLVFNWVSSSRRKFIAITLIVYAIVLVVTQIYFVPELILFEHSPESTISGAEWLARGRRWQKLSWLRAVIMYAAYVPLLFALSKPADDMHLS